MANTSCSTEAQRRTVIRQKNNKQIHTLCVITYKQATPTNNKLCNTEIQTNVQTYLLYSLQNGYTNIRLTNNQQVVGQKHNTEQTYDKMTNNKQQTVLSYAIPYKQTPTNNIQTIGNYEQVIVQTENSNSTTERRSYEQRGCCL